MEINQLGGVFVFNNQDPNGNWKKIALAFNYDLVNNFDNETFVSGNSGQGIDNYFLGFAQGVPLSDLQTPDDGRFVEDYYLDLGTRNNGFALQQAFLGFQSFLIDPVDPDNGDNTDYFSNAEYSAVNQNYINRTAGYNSKFYRKSEYTIPRESIFRSFFEFSQCDL